MAEQTKELPERPDIRAIKSLDPADFFAPADRQRLVQAALQECLRRGIDPNDAKQGATPENLQKIEAWATQTVLRMALLAEVVQRGHGVLMREGVVTVSGDVTVAVVEQTSGPVKMAARFLPPAAR